MLESGVDALIYIDLEYVGLYNSPILSVGKDSGCGNGTKHQKHYYHRSDKFYSKTVPYPIPSDTTIDIASMKFGDLARG